MRKLSHTEPESAEPTPHLPMHTLSLPDGRTLAWDEFGDPQGPAVFHFHGSPACRLMWDGAKRSAEQHGVRLISADRPGIGDSAFDPHRTIGSWAGDVAAIADELRIERFSVVGASGGGPYALSCAAGLPDRVAEAYVLCGVGPLDSVEARSAMNPINRGFFEAAALGPSSAIPGVDVFLGKAAASGAPVISMDEMLAATPAQDLAAMKERPSFMAAMAETQAFMGARDPLGPAYDLWLYTRPWDFDLASIAVPVHFHAGAHDTNVPLAHVQFQYGAVPGSTLTVWPDEGHLVGTVRLPEVLEQIAGREGRATPG